MSPSDEADQRRAEVSDYYGRVVKESGDLRTNACCPIDAVPQDQRVIVGKLHPEVIKRFYGCGSPIPDRLRGVNVLDLGCGTGRDAFVASGLVGPEGRVIGIDMTPAQLEVARQYRDYHAKVLLGPDAESNVDLREGVIEDLAAAGVLDSSQDVVISNCVCNLTADKLVVWREIARVLRDGGELYFSDVYADRRLSAEARTNPVLIGECLGGAMYLGDFRRSLQIAGFHDTRIVNAAPIQLHDPELRALVPDVSFYSVTIRAFKLTGLEEGREDYGQTAKYIGSSDQLRFDTDHTFPVGTNIPVDGNMATILQKSRYREVFEVTNRGPHRGLFKFGSNGGNVSTILYSTRAENDARDNRKACKEKVKSCTPKQGGCSPPDENPGNKKEKACTPKQEPTAKKENGGCGKSKTSCC